METPSPAPGDTLAARDGVALRLYAWPSRTPEVQGPPDATAAADRPAPGRVLIVHGLGEHAGRHAALATLLCRQGWRVHAYDQRGHGRSGGARGALPRPDALLDDLGQVIDHLGLRDAGAGRFVLLGHSMGGLVAARFVAEALAARPAAWAREPDALVLSSPALDPGMTWVQWLRLWIGERLLPDRAEGNGLDPAWVSRDPAVVRAYVADPLVHDRITARLARFIVDAGVRVRAEAPRWRVPTLLMWGGADRCVAPAGSAAMAAAAPRGVLTARPFDGLAHEIFNEPEREQVLGELRAWLAAQAARAGVPAVPAAG